MFSRLEKTLCLAVERITVHIRIEYNNRVMSVSFIIVVSYVCSLLNI